MTKYICQCCGEEKEDWPAIAYAAPYPYFQLSEEEIKNSELTSDWCIINYPDETCYFIRAVLVQKVNEGCQDLEYGVWVSLSEKSFNEYVENYDNKEFESGYFGWLSNYLPDYEFENSIPTDVIVDNKTGRPFVYPHESHEHTFVKDFHEGISKKEAEKRINFVLNRSIK
ncbi:MULTISPECIES: DUF2199 domain-containing protein [unclassified Chryseobacterium]|uniref:DUF2199 domain-containing protein n=1 Tax=unclassified Chryseobacterium TaxID=2593645 RepID=UPI000D3A624C|nr:MULTISPECIES: DUF2199 domain-containing protein [unclassified Chryseobacterium]PTT73214.1 DUF2199 domain-containing protein [Chryseobacterium sp. HMWF001]PVV60735.1 DUF2199 domain-containing protein [Chryseobacterium sp. HMWF035]